MTLSDLPKEEAPMSDSSIDETAKNHKRLFFLKNARF
jgi:hypothetical protein